MLKDYFADFRDYIGELEKRGKLHRWSRPVNKDTELMPLMRLQYRGIDDTSGKRSCTRTCATATTSNSTSKSPRESMAPRGTSHPWDWVVMIRWIFMKSGAMRWRICTSRRSSRPRRCKKRCYSGSRLKEFPVTRLPSPVEEPGFSCAIRVTAPFITKDPESGVRNVGMYSGHFRADHKLIAGIARRTTPCFTTTHRRAAKEALARGDRAWLSPRH